MAAEELDWKGLSTLEAGDLQMRLLDNLDGLMRGLPDEDEDRVLAELPDPLRVMQLLNWLDFEVMMGGFLGYFANSQGRHARLAVQALREIGATGMASILERATQTYEAGADAWTARHDEIDQTTELYAVIRPYEGLPNVDELVELTAEYRAEADTGEWWGELLDRYLRRSIAELAGSTSDGG